MSSSDTSLARITDESKHQSKCLVNCKESTLAMELSSAESPGFMALCGGEDSFLEYMACQVQGMGICIGQKVCDTLYLYETEDPGDVIHLVF